MGMCTVVINKLIKQSATTSSGNAMSSVLF